jgi:nondiscriminating glutamyl-tRNA synthetase
LTDTVRVRFAPSPTGFLHVGGARTALFNWLFARRYGGTFVLRIEDTDRARERPEFREEIFRALRWLGISEDEGPNAGGEYGPYAQSERLELYAAALETLRKNDRVYPCFCVGQTEAESEEGAAYEDRSSRCACNRLEASERERLTQALGRQPAMRVRVDATASHEVDDLIRGPVLFPPGEVEDFIITKAGGDPLYNFVVVVDDAAMRITHVIRGEEHLANTPKQILLHRALGHEPPRFAHLPIILNAERKKLSKRDGATAVSDYRAQGYLPEALRNFLALLGWSPGEDRELMALEEMIERFSLERVQKSGAVFDTVKLTWMNGEYVRKASTESIVDALETLIVSRPADADMRYSREHLFTVVDVVRERVKTIAEILDLSYFFSRETTLAWDADAVAKRAGTPEALDRLAAAREALNHVEPFARVEIEAALRGLSASTGVKAGDYIAPLRVALTGTAVSPGIFEVCEALGRQIVVGRVDAFLRAYRNGGAS